MILFKISLFDSGRVNLAQLKLRMQAPYVGVAVAPFVPKTGLVSFLALGNAANMTVFGDPNEPTHVSLGRHHQHAGVWIFLYHVSKRPALLFTLQPIVTFSIIILID